MADNSVAEKGWTRVGKTRALWWTGGAVVLIALVGLTWIERKRIHFSSMHEWITHPPDWFLPLGLAVCALLALAIIWKVPQWQVGRVRRLDTKERFDRVNEARKTLATILGGIVLLAGFFGTWQNIKVAQDAASTSQRALAVSQEGQITDRFGKAIEQLGAVDLSGKKKLEVRLGGIYALEGIANESKELHWPIMEVLCTYVRLNAPRKPHESNQKNQASIGSSHPDADIQAILTVLGRRDRKNEKPTQRLDVTNADIRGADLDGANFSGADLALADLSGANLVGANFGGAVLYETHLKYVGLYGTNLDAANLMRADLRWALGLTQKQVDSAIGDSATQLPENLHMPESWKK